MVEGFQLSDLPTRNGRSGGTRPAYHGEIGADLWQLGAWWADKVAAAWERAVRETMAAVQAESQRRHVMSAATTLNLHLLDLDAVPERYPAFDRVRVRPRYVQAVWRVDFLDGPRCRSALSPAVSSPGVVLSKRWHSTESVLAVTGCQPTARRRGLLLLSLALLVEAPAF